jgi:hypothetical protein
MDHEVTDGTDASLSNQSPQHVCAVVAVCRLVERFLGKEVAMAMLIVFTRYKAGRYLTGRTACLFTAT